MFEHGKLPSVNQELIELIAAEGGRTKAGKPESYAHSLRNQLADKDWLRDEGIAWLKEDQDVDVIKTCQDSHL